MWKGNSKVKLYIRSNENFPTFHFSFKPFNRMIIERIFDRIVRHFNSHKNVINQYHKVM